jgi:8-oxo-dGTP pyrophosphatase MutT (NUDIX family)
LLESFDNELPVYLVTSSIEKTFSTLFQDFEFVEAAGGIVKRKDSYLFIKRNGFWDIPKGKLDEGEIPEKAAVREIEEECGIVGPKLNDPICLTYHTYLYKGRPTIKKTYWYSLDYDGDKKLKGQKEEGITKVKWFKLDEIEKIRKNTFASILEVMDVYFSDK